MAAEDFRHHFTETIERYPALPADTLERTEQHYRAILPDIAFIETSGNPMDQRMDFCAYFLALIKTLDAQRQSYETIREICLKVVTSYVTPRSKFRMFLKKLPAKLLGTWLSRLFVNPLAKKICRNNSPQGFIAQVITDKKETFGLGYGVDIIECGICKLYAKHKYEKYTPILCEVDEMTSSMAGLQLVRTGTIALGAKKCDFRYRKA